MAGLIRAIEPLLVHIRGVATTAEHEALKRITGCQYFETRDARKLKDMLLRAAKHARSNLGIYFPLIQESVIAQAEHLEDTAQAYYRRFKRLQNTTIPVN